MTVLVLNASYEPVNVCTVRRAIVLLLKERAEVLEADEIELHAERWAVLRPQVIRLITYVHIPRVTRRRITRSAILARDRWTCQYCGATSRLTVDHVIPRSRGGTTAWENAVCSCWPCNRRKGSALPHEAGMTLARVPRAPAPTVFVTLTVRTVPPIWSAYLPVLG